MNFLKVTKFIISVIIMCNNAIISNTGNYIDKTDQQKEILLFNSYEDYMIYSNIKNKVCKYVDTLIVIDVCKKLIDISKLYNGDPVWLINVINAESGWNTSIENIAGSGAVGLIQFMPKTAISLGTTSQEIKKACIIQQLDLVKMYLLQFPGKLSKIKSYEDLYLLVFFPKAVGKLNTYVIAKKGKDRHGNPLKLYHYNRWIDYNNDGLLSVLEFKQFSRNLI